MLEKLRLSQFTSLGAYIMRLRNLLSFLHSSTSDAIVVNWIEKGIKDTPYHSELFGAAASMHFEQRGYLYGRPPSSVLLHELNKLAGREASQRSLDSSSSAGGKSSVKFSNKAFVVTIPPVEEEPSTKPSSSPVLAAGLQPQPRPPQAPNIGRGRPRPSGPRSSRPDPPCFNDCGENHHFRRCPYDVLPGSRAEELWKRDGILSFAPKKPHPKKSKPTNSSATPAPTPQPISSAMSIDTPRSELIQITATMNGVPVDAVVDSGAVFTFVSVDAASRMGLDLNTLQPAHDIQVESACGTIQTPLDAGPVTIQVESSEVHLPSCLVLPGLRHDALLGLNWGNAADVQISLKSGTIHFPPTSTSRKNPDPTHRVLCAVAVSLPDPPDLQQAIRLSRTTVPDPPEVVELLPSPLTNPPTPTVGGVTSSTPISQISSDQFRLMVQSHLLSPDMPAELREPATDILCEYQDCFAQTPDDLAGPAKLPIGPYLLEVVPGNFNARYRARHSPVENTAIIDQVQTWLKAGIVEPCTAPNPVINNLLTVPKPNGQLRVCLDPRPLNLATVSDVVPPPTVTETLDSLRGEIFAKFDLFSGYLQIEVDSSCRHLLAFTCDIGTFQFTRLPFGLKNACAFFNRALREVERTENLEDVEGYFDDQILATYIVRFLSHLRHLLEVARKYNLKYNFPKSLVGAASLSALGHYISNSGISPDPAKIAAIMQLPIPTTVGHVQSFLGLTGYYQRFIRSYSDLAAPLYELTQKGRTWFWSDACEAAFHSLREALVSAPVLRQPDFSLPFILHCDASDIGLGVVLSQRETADPRSPEHPIAFFSRKLSPAESNYTVTERELLAVVFGVTKARPYIYGTRCTVVSDHSALRYLLGQRDLSGRLARWSIALSQFDLVILHRPGAANANADALSRLPVDEGLSHSRPGSSSSLAPDTLSAVPVLMASVLAVTRSASASTSTVAPPSVTPPPPSTPPPDSLPYPIPLPPGTPSSLVGDTDDVLLPDTTDSTSQSLEAPDEPTTTNPSPTTDATPQHSPPSQPLETPKKRSSPLVDIYEDEQLMDFVRTRAMPEVNHRRRATLERLSSSFSFLPDSSDHSSSPSASSDKFPRGNFYYFHRPSEDWLLVPRPIQRREIILRAHLLGHFRQASTVSRLIEHYKVFWPSIEHDVHLVISACSQCLEMRTISSPEHPARALSVPSLFHRIGMDLVTGLPLTERGNAGVLVIVEYLSKFPMVFPIKSKTAVEISRHLFSFISLFGPPREIISDQGPEFVNSVVKQLSNNLGIERRVTSPYHPRTDGLVERTNQTLIRALEIHANSHAEDWDLYLDFICLAYRTRVNSVTGHTPFELLFGRVASIFDNFTDSAAADTAVAESLLHRAVELRRFVESSQPNTVSAIVERQESQRRGQDARVLPRNLFTSSLPVNTVVFTKLLRRAKKLEPRYGGPYKIASVSPGGNYWLQNHHKRTLKRPFPIDQLKVITDPEVADEIWKAACDPRGKLSPVSCILDHQRIKDVSYYLVRWKGFDPEDDSWTRETDIGDPDLITAFWSSRPSRSSPYVQPTPY